jgi:hypothetical protein
MIVLTTMHTSYYANMITAGWKTIITASFARCWWKCSVITMVNTTGYTVDKFHVPDRH